MGKKCFHFYMLFTPESLHSLANFPIIIIMVNFKCYFSRAHGPFMKNVVNIHLRNKLVEATVYDPK